MQKRTSNSPQGTKIIIMTQPVGIAKWFNFKDRHKQPWIVQEIISFKLGSLTHNRSLEKVAIREKMLCLSCNLQKIILVRGDSISSSILSRLKILKFKLIKWNQRGQMCKHRQAPGDKLHQIWVCRAQRPKNLTRSSDNNKNFYNKWYPEDLFRAPQGIKTSKLQKLKTHRMIFLRCEISKCKFNKNLIK